SLAEGELSRISHIARQTLALYRESTTPVPIKITEVLEDVLEVFATRMRSNQVKLERRYEFTGELPGFPAELRQLFANVITNALEATKEKDASMYTLLHGARKRSRNVQGCEY